MKDPAPDSTAPLVTPADLEAEISAEFFFTAHEGVVGALNAANAVGSKFEAVSIRHDDNAAEPHLRRLTFCVLVLRNGFVVSGESAPVCPENFDATKGRNAARASAISKCWPLLGFRLRDALSGQKFSDGPSA